MTVITELKGFGLSTGANTHHTLVKPGQSKTRCESALVSRHVVRNAGEPYRRMRAKPEHEVQ